LRKFWNIGVSFLAIAFMVVGVSTVAEAADENTPPSRTLTAATPIPSSSSFGLSVVGVTVNTNDQALVARYDDGDVVIFSAGASGSATPILTLPGIQTATFVSIGRDNRIYVGSDFNAHQVSVFDLSGNLLGRITGANTTLACPASAGVDAQGFIYVSDCENDVVNVFAPGTLGDVAPVRVIGALGSSANITNPVGIDVQADGSFWLANRGHHAVSFWPPGAAGDVAAQKTISGNHTTLHFPQSVKVASNGQIAVSTMDTSNVSGVSIFNSTDTGDVAPARRLVGPATLITAPWQVAIDSHGSLYVAQQDGHVLVYDGIFPATIEQLKPVLAETGQSATPLMGMGVGLIALGAIAFSLVVALGRRSGSASS
jgi:hypothetical protein